MTLFRSGPLSCAAGIVLELAVAGMAQAAQPPAFHISSQPPLDAIQAFAVQAGVSVGGLPPGGCGPLSRPVFGRMAPATALRRLLPPPCTFDEPAPATFRILPSMSAATRPTHALAQPQTEVASLVVTAQKRPEALATSPASVSALSQADVVRLGSDGLEALAPQMGGVNATNLGSGRDKLFIRGISDGAFTGRTQSTVGLYLDDLPITYNAPDPDLRLADMERVEVLRGPQGTLYGSGSIGGVLHLVTRAPNPTAWSGSAMAGGAVTAHGQPSGSLEAVLNAPLMDHQAALRGVVYTDQRGGYLDAPGEGRTNANRGHRTGGRLSGLVQAPGDWVLQAGLAKQSIYTHDSQYVSAVGDRVRTNDVAEPHDNDFSEISLAALHTGALANLRLGLGYVDHDLNTRYQATGAFAADGFGSRPAAYDEGQGMSLWAAEALLQSQGPGRVSWLAGAFVTRARERSDAEISTVGSGPALSLPIYRRRDELDEVALYGEASIGVSRRTTLTLGARAFSATGRLRADSFGLAPGLAAAAAQRDDKGLAPKFRVTYALDADNLIYTQVEEGYRVGGFNLPAAAYPGSGGAAPAGFRPDRLWNAEVGVRLGLLQNRLRLNAAAFYDRWHRVQTDQYLASGLPLTVNIGDGSNRGVEADVAWQVWRGLQLRLNLLLDDPEITRASEILPAQVELGLPAAPSRMAAADLRYAWSLSQRLQAEVSGQYAYQGRSYVTFAGGPNSAMGRYGVGRLEAAVFTQRTRLSLYIDNVGDTHADTFAFGNPFLPASAPQRTPLRPRTLGLELRQGF